MKKQELLKRPFFAPLTWHDLFKQAANVHHAVGTKLRVWNTGELQVAQLSWKTPNYLQKPYLRNLEE